tara:strand:- start:777 stop:1121 length:345 start_codon:yes stop_codon:yes gene_type:complete
MAAVYVSNIVINQGASFEQTFNLTNASNTAVDLSLYDASAQLRKHSGSTTKTDFTVDDTTNPSGGQVSIKLTPTQTSDLKPGRYVYDIVITKTSDLSKTRVVEGSALVREGVTK